jgi:hypothetical protein
MIARTKKRLCRFFSFLSFEDFFDARKDLFDVVL